MFVMYLAETADFSGTLGWSDQSVNLRWETGVVTKSQKATVPRGCTKVQASWGPTLVRYGRSIKTGSESLMSFRPGAHIGKLTKHRFQTVSTDFFFK
ncbi:hypothetical protein DBR06_SOUSAS3110106 [Sousa chinensis]|nr:hypothetical protein DBR06_SOUSAS3110106 [Sousa chinensis]